MAVAMEEMELMPKLVVELQMFELVVQPIQIDNLWQAAAAVVDLIVVTVIKVVLAAEQPVEPVISVIVKVHILELVEISHLVALIKVVLEQEDLLVKAVMGTILTAAVAAVVIMVVVALVTVVVVVVPLGGTAQRLQYHIPKVHVQEMEPLH
jgi:hypothetical protein